MTNLQKLFKLIMGVEIFLNWGRWKGQEMGEFTSPKKATKTTVVMPVLYQILSLRSVPDCIWMKTKTSGDQAGQFIMSDDEIHLGYISCNI